MGTSDTWYGHPIQGPSPQTLWQVLSWTATEPPGSTVQVYYRINGALGTWINAGTSPAILNVAGQSFEVKAVLSATNGATAPTLGTVMVNYLIP